MSVRFFRRLLIVLAPLALLASFYRFDTPPKLSAPVATYSHGLLRVSLQYNTVRPLDGSLTLEVLDPDDKQIAHSEQVVKARRGQSEWV
ncbi:MAG: hypothetical protein JO061_15745, partial [Acidobacteriaceae bacterium]|nr:hypothetical protein [Acidobacteriaceae bacterium]